MRSDLLKAVFLYPDGNMEIFTQLYIRHHIRHLEQ